MFYEDVFKKLNEKHVDYVVIGGVALVLHGVVRLTADLDLAVDLEEKNLKKLISVMAELGYKPIAPVKPEDLLDPSIREKWIREKNMLAFGFHHPKNPSLVDIIIKTPIKYRELKKHAVKIKTGHLNVPVISVQDLLKIKQRSGRPQDLTDIEALRKVNKREG